MNRWRHQPGVPLSPNSRAVSAGMLCVATSCCCSPIAVEKAKGLIAEADQPDHRKRQQGQRRARGHPQPLAAAGRGEHDKGQR